MRVLIVDDEKPARDKLRRLLGRCAGIEIAGEAGSGVAALAAVETLAPDVVFLDVQMPDVTGLEVAASLPAPAPLVVFVTAHDAHALAAFDLDAVDYLLKPYDAARLQRSLERVRARLAAPAAAARAASLPVPARLLVREGDSVRVLPVAEIAWLEATANYVTLHVGGRRPLLRQTLQALVVRLGARFVRVHRGAAVNLEQVAEIVPLFKGDAEIVLKDGSRVPLSRQYRAALLDAVERSLPAP